MSVRSRLLDAGYAAALRPYLFASHGGDPEAVHEVMIDRLAAAAESPALLAVLRMLSGRPADPVTVAGVRFPGRVGVAAGLDKDGRAARAWAALGFAFAELGTVTALAQPGQDRPRVFRLTGSKAIINRMGFNNGGAGALAGRLHGLGVRRGNNAVGIPLGISLGKTKRVGLEDAVHDYVTSFRALAPYADYIAVNVSSPNTPGLRGLQDPRLLADLVGALTREAEQLHHPDGPVPIFVKLAPDLSRDALATVIAVVEDTGGRGLIACNTTLERHGIAPREATIGTEAGGLSGAPLRRRALEVVSYVANRTTLPVMGVGGIMSPEDAGAMLDAGAQLVQLYTGFIYGGTGLVVGINARERTP